MRHSPWRVDDSPGICRPCKHRADRSCRLHALRAADMRRGVSGRCDQADSGRCRTVIACPFGVPEVYDDRKIMMKCDMCYDRSSAGKKPMCATVCPSQALFFGTREQIAQLRPMSEAVNRFQFGAQVISTQVFMMAPRSVASRQPWVDVTSAMDEAPRERSIILRVLSNGSTTTPPPPPQEEGTTDPFADISV
jgi:Fe-S-cluster-containing dehydrogenase component